MRAFRGAIGALLLATSAPLAAQDTAPVTVLDSPLAWQLLQQAEDQSRENPGESARLCQKLLDGYGDRVIPAEPNNAERFDGVAERVERFLRSHPSVLERYRQIEGPEAERMLRFDAPERVAATRAMTRAGLSANLRLAERELHAARFGHALMRLRRLEGHPDLATEDGTTYWFLRGASAALAGKDGEIEQAEARLRALGLVDDSPELGTITRFKGIHPRAVPEPVSPLSAGILPESDERGWQPVWSEPLDASPFTRIFMLPDPVGRVPLPNRLDRGRFDGAYLVVAPTAFGDLVLISDGGSIRALDRLSHRTVWRRDIDVGRIDGDINTVSDLAAVAVGDGFAVTYPGYGFVNERGTVARVLCLDLKDGATRWETPLATLPGNEFEDLFPIGVPVIADGSVYCIARKVTSRLETVDYLLAFSADTGAMRFATYLAGAGGVNMQGLRPASVPVVADGSVYVSTSAGAIARIDAADGHIQWLERFLVPVRTGRYPTEPWEMGGPVLVGDWLFAVAPNLESVVQLNRETGHIENMMPTGVNAAWGTPRYLVADEGFDLTPPRIFAVGGDVIAFDPDRPTLPLWSMSEVNAEAFKSRGGLASRTGIRGRVQVARSSLVVPGIEDVLLVSRETGRVQERIEIEGPANPALVGPQLLLGQNAQVTALMPAASAERLMRERITREPGDPEGGLALLDLGLRSKRLDLCIEAARSAKRAIDEAAPSASNDRAREELVARLLRVAELDDGRTPAVEPVHTLLAECARTPSQLVRHLLSWADWLAAQERWTDAVAAADRVLAEPMLAGEPFVRDDETRVVAATEAIARFERWEARAVDAVQARAARAAQQLAAADAQDPAALARLALSAPLTPTAIDAAVAASAGFARRQQWRDGWLTLQRVLRTVPRDESHRPQLAAVVGASIELALAAGWTQSARVLADTMFAEVGNMSVRVKGAEATLEALRSAEVPKPATLGGEPGPVRELPGRLVQSVWGGLTGLGAAGNVLFADGNTLLLTKAPDFAPIWKAPISDRDPIVLDIAPPTSTSTPSDAILLWQAPSDREASASWLNLRDGALLAATPAMGELFSAEALLEGGRPVNQQMPNESPFLPSQIIPVVTSKMLVLVRRNGDLVAFALNDLSKPAWRIARAIDQVYEVGWTDWGIAVAGRNPGAAGTVGNGGGNGAAASSDDANGRPIMLVVDPATGETLTRTDLGAGHDVVWLRLFETGEAVVGTHAGVLTYEGGGAIAPPKRQASALPPPAALRWQLDAIESHDSAGAWRIGDTLLLAIASEISEAVVPIDLTKATLLEDRFRPPPRLDNRRPELRSGGRFGDLALLQYRDRVVAFDLHGATVGEDAVADEERDFGAALPANDTILVVSNGVPRQILMADGSGLRFEYSYMLYRLSASEGCRLLGPGIRVRTVGQRAERWSVVDGFVIVSTNGGSLAVPLPPS